MRGSTGVEDSSREGFFTSFNCKPKDKAGSKDGVQPFPGDWKG